MTRSERALQERQAAFVEIVKELAAEDDPERLFARIGERVCQLLGTDSASLCVVEGDELAVRAACGLEGPLHGAPRRKIAESPVGRVVLTRRAYATADMTRDPHWRGSEVVTRWGYRAILEVPVVLRGEVIGAMAALDKAPREFSGEDTALLSALADHTALALERARLIGETQAQRQEAEVLAELASTITASLDLDTVLERVAKGARELCGSDMAQIALVDPDSGMMRVRHPVGARYHGYDALRIEVGKGVGGQVLLTGRPFRTVNYAEDPRISTDYLEVIHKEGVVADLAVPIRIGDRIEGVLFVANRSPRPFTDRDEAILVRLADHAAIAIKNARLYGELRAALEAVEASQQRIIQAEKLRALGEMAGGIAHDFNNALAAILGRAQLLLTRVQDPDLRRQIRVIEKVSMEAAQTVRRIQEFTRTKRLRPFEAVDLNRVVEEVVEFTRARWADEAQAKGVAYEVRVEASPVPPVAGDPSELREALTNLALNALDAMPGGGRLAFRTGVDGERVFCVVADTGVGMAEEVRRRALDPFFTTKGPRGTGLGLSIVYGIVRRHSGEVEVRSQVGQGSAFTIWLPAGRAVPGAPEEPGQLPPGRSARVLVIDDEPEVRDLLAELLTGQGHVVTACADGHEGLSRLEQEPVDLVITDLGMPGLSGWEVAEAVKRRRPGTPVALITGWGDRIDPEEARAKRVDFVVGKPFRIDEIASVIARAVSGARPASPSP